MANIAAIRSVGASLAHYFNNAYGESVFPDSVVKPACTFSLTTIGGLNDTEITTENSVQVLIILHKIGMNPHLRNAAYQSNRDRKPLPVSVELHYLFSFWAPSADYEQLVLAWTLRELQTLPSLDQSILTKEAGWSAEDTIQLVPDEISTEEMMRIWDSLQPDYRLSLSYVARVVRIDPDPQGIHKPVVAFSTGYGTVGGADS